MNTLVDTPVWSLALRRKHENLSPQEKELLRRLDLLIRAGQAQIIGPVRQELLSGIREEAQFFRIRNDLREFVDSTLQVDDYEEAARMSNVCRRSGIAGTAIDLLLCAVASRNQWAIFTTDRDFERYSDILGVKLFSA